MRRQQNRNLPFILMILSHGFFYLLACLLYLATALTMFLMAALASTLLVGTTAPRPRAPRPPTPVAPRPAADPRPPAPRLPRPPPPTPNLQKFTLTDFFAHNLIYDLFFLTRSVFINKKKHRQFWYQHDSIQILCNSIQILCIFDLYYTISGIFYFLMYIFALGLKVVGL